MQTGTAALQNICDSDPIESRCENGMLGIESKSIKKSSGDQEENFLIALMAQHMPPDNEKGQLNETINADSFAAKDPNRSIIKNETLVKSENSGIGKINKIQIDESKSKVKSGGPHQVSTGVYARKTAPDIESQPRDVELAGRSMALSKKEIRGLKDTLSQHSENDTPTRFVNNSSTKPPAVVTSLDVWQKYMNVKSGGQKPQILEGNINVSSEIKLETNNGEETNLTSNNQTAEKNLESVVQTKEPSYFQRQFQPVVMRQLVDKAIFGMKNGKSLIQISLKPELLGHLRMRISTENNQVAVRIITEVPMVKEIIESNLNQLRTDLQNQGLEIDKFNVYVDHGSTQNDRNPSHILFQNDEDRKGEEKIKRGLTEETRGPVQDAEKGIKSTLIDFFA